MTQRDGGGHADGRDAVGVIAIVVVTGLFLAALAPAMQLWDRDEPFYARVAVEMLRGGNWMVPTFNGEVFPDKPPLVYWMMAVGMRIFGENEFAVRLPAIVGMLASLVWTGAIARHIFDARTGRWAMIILATSLMAVYLGAAAMLETVLLATVTMAFWAWLGLRDGRPARVQTAWLTAALAASMLTKGPVGPVVFGSAVLATWAFGPQSQRPGWREVRALASAGLLAMAVFLAWAVPANSLSGGMILSDGFWVHIVGRAVAPMQGHGGAGLGGYMISLPVYVPVVILGLMPWTVDLPQAWTALTKGQLATGHHRMFLITWPATTFTLFTFAATKLPHYIFPLFPAAAIVLAAFHVGRTGADVSVGPKGWGIGDIVYAVVLAGTVLGLLILTWLLAAPGAAVLALVLAATTIAFLTLRHVGRPRLAHRLAVAAIPPCFLLAYWCVAPAVEAITKTAGAVARSIEDAGHGGLPVFADDTLEPSLVFELRRAPNDPVRALPPFGEAAAAVLSQHTDAILVVATPLYDEIARVVPQGSLQILSRHMAFNINKAGREGETVVARFTASR